MSIADVTILGGGIFGLSIAWEMAQRGAQVRVVEARHVGAGSSGGLVGALAPHTPEGWNEKKAFQLDSLLMAEPWWHTVQAAGGVDPGFARTGRLQPIADDSALALAHQRAEGARDLWQGKAVWQVLRAEAFGTWAPPAPSGWVIHDTLTARLHPQKACAALTAALRSIGAEVVEGDPDHPQEGKVVEATGTAGLLELNEGHPRQIGAGIKGQAALFRCDAHDAPQLFLGGLHIVPHSDGTVALGSTSERAFDSDDSTDAQLDALIETARARLPALAEAPVIARWAGVRPRTRSRAPMLGAHPLRPEHFIANGGFKIGFGMAPKVAQVMADLVLDGRDRVPEGFRPEASL